MDYVALTENRVLQNPAVDLYMLHMCYICSDSVFRQTPFAGFLVQKSDSGFSCLS